MLLPFSFLTHNNLNIDIWRHVQLHETTGGEQVARVEKKEMRTNLVTLDNTAYIRLI